MADLKAAVDFLLPLEDESMKGVVVRLSDGAGLTRFGLTSKWHPELVTKCFFDASLPVDEAEAMAEQAYETQYGPELGISAITSQAIANVLLAFAVNEGTTEAVSLAQGAAGAAIDGQCGPLTIAAINSCDPTRLVNGICDRQNVFYNHIATVNPAKAQFLHGWLNRVTLTRQRALALIPEAA